MINEETLNKVIRKKVLWAEIKANEQEYNRIGKQIDELMKARQDISFQVQKRLEEGQQIAEWLDQKQYENETRLDKK